MELFGIALTTVAVSIFFALLPGISVIIGGFLFGMVVAVPILAIGSLIWLVPRPAEKAPKVQPDTAATQGTEPTCRDTQTGEPTWAAQP